MILLGDLQAPQALDYLKERLDKEVASQYEWRRKRDAPEEQVQQELDKLETAKLQPHLAFELAYNIARIDPGQSGVSLLSHELADIRQGAWQGLGRVGSVALIEALRQQSKTSKQSWFQPLRRSANPFFRQAAYQAIDHILLRLEAEGDSQDLERLKSLVPGQVEAPCPKEESLEGQGICRRVKWTIAQLAAKDVRRALHPAAGSPNQGHRTP